jgi:RNA recognition motif-containing protein
LYNSNKGASLVITNTEKGEKIVRNMMGDVFHGRELKISDALKYQGPMRGPIAENSNRKIFLADLQNTDYDHICKKWAKRSSMKLLISKYVWGTNRQKVNWWKLKHYFTK